MARDGYFNDLDFSLYWHPSPATWASTSKWDALIEFDIGFVGKRSDIVHDPVLFANALAAFEMFIQRLPPLSGRINDSVKMNYTIRQWKTDVNKIPDTIKLGFKIQCARQQSASESFDEIKNTVHEISRATGVTAFITVQKAMHQFLPNATAMKAVHANMELLRPVSYDPEEQDFVKELQRNLKIPEQKIEDRIPLFSDQSGAGKMYGYASDIGEASWIAPEAYFTVKTLPPVYMHTWQGTVFSGHSIGQKGMIHAAKILAMTIVDFVENKPLQNAIQKDFIENKSSYRYRSVTEPGQMPLIPR
jgi:aminobenzoyl-glutamate utilization protein B